MPKTLPRQILERLDKHSEMLHDIDKKVAVVVERIEDTNNGIKRHEERLKNHSGKIDTLEKDQNQMQGKLAGIAAAVSTFIAGIGIIIGKIWR